MKEIEKMITDAGGVYGLAVEKDTNKVLYITPQMKANPYIKIKEGDIVPADNSNNGPFGDGSEDLKKLIFDSFAKELWFYAYTISKTLENGTEVVLKYCVPTQTPQKQLFVLTSEKI